MDTNKMFIDIIGVFYLPNLTIQNLLFKYSKMYCMYKYKLIFAIKAEVQTKPN